MTGPDRASGPRIAGARSVQSGAMGSLLSPEERRILEAAHDAEVEGRPEADDAETAQLTDVVRRTLGQLPGRDFRQGVASLAGRQLLRAQVAVKADGEVGRVVIERTTFLGRRAIGRR